MCASFRGWQSVCYLKKKERKKKTQARGKYFFSKDAFRLIEIISQKNVDSTNNLFRNFSLRNIWRNVCKWWWFRQIWICFDFDFLTISVSRPHLQSKYNHLRLKTTRIDKIIILNIIGRHSWIWRHFSCLII